MLDDITAVQKLDGWWAKREDWAAYNASMDYPSGLKVRQYLAMAATMPDVPMVVGCAAGSAMQIYVAHAAQLCKREAYVFVPARKIPTLATVYAEMKGAKVTHVKGTFTNVARAKAKQFVKDTLDGHCIPWLPRLAVEDVVRQCVNLPRGCRRVVVPCGSGLCAAGVVIGIAKHIPMAEWPTVHAVAVSDLAGLDDILQLVNKYYPERAYDIPTLTYVRAPGKYGDARMAHLPDGTRLDAWYAAKALPYVEGGDCLWVTGCRPLAAMPAKCKPASK